MGGLHRQERGAQIGSTRQWHPGTHTTFHNPASLWRGAPHIHRTTALNGRKFPPARMWESGRPRSQMSGRNPNVRVPPLRSNNPPPPPDRHRLFFLSRIRIPGTSVAYPSCMPACLREWGEAVAETSPGGIPSLPVPAKVPSFPGVANERLLSRLPIHVVGCVAVPFPSDPWRGDSRADGKRPRGEGGGPELMWPQICKGRARWTLSACLCRGLR